MIIVPTNNGFKRSSLFGLHIFGPINMSKKIDPLLPALLHYHSNAIYDHDYCDNLKNKAQYQTYALKILDTQTDHLYLHYKKSKVELFCLEYLS